MPVTTTLLADRVRAVSLEEEDCSDDDAVKRAMQALRIVVNGEFDALDELLVSLPDILAPGGRAVFLTFHSGEDRRVKSWRGRRLRNLRGRGAAARPAVAAGTEPRCCWWRRVRVDGAEGLQHGVLGRSCD